MAESLDLAIKPVSRRPSFKADMQPVVSVRQSLDRPLDRQRTVLDVAEKPDLSRPAPLCDCNGVLLLGVVRYRRATVAALSPPSTTARTMDSRPLGVRSAFL